MSTASVVVERLGAIDSAERVGTVAAATAAEKMLADTPFARFAGKAQVALDDVLGITAKESGVDDLRHGMDLITRQFPQTWNAASVHSSISMVPRGERLGLATSIAEFNLLNAATRFAPRSDLTRLDDLGSSLTANLTTREAKIIGLVRNQTVGVPSPELVSSVDRLTDLNGFASNTAYHAISNGLRYMPVLDRLPPESLAARLFPKDWQSKDPIAATEGWNR